MTDRARDAKNHRAVEALQEREKELYCLYAIEDILTETDSPIESTMDALAGALPLGWQYPQVCHAVISLPQTTHCSSRRIREVVSFASECSAPILLQGEEIGRVTVGYETPMPETSEGPFLEQELKLLTTVASRISQFIRHQNVEATLRSGLPVPHSTSRHEWKMVIDLLCKSDPSLLERITRKMINYLLMQGIGDAKHLLGENNCHPASEDYRGEYNTPKSAQNTKSTAAFSEATFNAAETHLDDSTILSLIQRWIREDKLQLLIKPLVNVHASLTDICDGIQRYQNLKPEGIELSESCLCTIRVALIRRFLTDQLDYIGVAKRYLTPEVFFGLAERLIFPAGSHGKIGGKAAGLMLATHILEHHSKESEDIGRVRVPKTWHITSEGLHQFVYYNNLEEFYEQKYKNIEEVKRDYPHIVQVFKSAHFPKDIVKGLSMALDDFGEVPIIVRSSSLLEDRLGAAFSGKYRSLFLPNTGDKAARLKALLDAISEVYASTFGPDPIQYRGERGLIDFNEQMAILIQEVVGKKVGPYFFPAYSGVAFSNNEFRWSSRICREDGLLRMVPGLGTRAVDRLTDDYPVLVAIDRPGLRVNVTVDETIRYSPKKMDVINLQRGQFDTVSCRDIVNAHGDAFPVIHQLVSILDDGMLSIPSGLIADFQDKNVHFTFEGLITNTPLLKKIRAILDTLSAVLKTPVDIEFASDGTDFYLLQCRPQSQFAKDPNQRIPSHIEKERILFTANRFISSGVVTGIAYIVYVIPEKYGKIATLEQLRKVGHCIGKLNERLPRREFILIGPGRWGSRGDIRLGVHVSYADINNTAMLLEVAKKTGSYRPDLSFGTHFFQDLVEAGIHYLPLYPDEEDVIFNEQRLLRAPNRLCDLVPEVAELSDVIRVVHTADIAEGCRAKIVMSPEENMAMGFCCP